MPYSFRSVGGTIILLLMFCMGGPYNCRAEESTSALDSLALENELLKARLSRLDVRRETFRWGRFSQSLVLLSGTVQQVQKLPESRLAFATADQGAVFFNGTAFEVIDSRFSGLADDFVTSIAPLPDGSLYLATAAGVQLYKNGVLSRVPNLPPQLETAMITGLAAPDGEHLWLGSQGLGVWYINPDGCNHWRAGADSTDLSHDDISCLAVDPTSGKLWVGTGGGGVCRLEDNRWQRFEQPLGEGSEEIYCLTIDSSGRVWIGTVGAGAGYWDGYNWQKASLPAQAGSAVVSITEIEGADLLFGTDDGAFILSRAQKRWQSLPLPEELAPYPVIAATEAYSRLWLALSGQGLHLFDRGIVASYSVEQGLPDNNVYRIAQSADSRIWCSTWNGVGLFDGHEWLRIGRRHGLPNNLTTFVLIAGEDTTWFGTHSGVARLTRGGWDYFNRDNGLASNTINHLALDSRGRLWISTEGGGLAVLEGDSLRAYRRTDGLPADEVQVSAPVGDGDEAWVGTKRGLVRIRRGKVLPLEVDSPGARTVPGPEHITGLRIAADGCLWAATYGHGVWRYKPDRTWRQFTMENGLSSNEVFTIAESKEGNLYFGTSMGLSVFDGAHWRSYATADGLYPGAVKSILPSMEGPLWLSTEDHGILCFDLTRFAAPETFIRTPAGRLLSLDRENRTLEFMAENQSQAPDSPISPGPARFVIEGSFYRAIPHGTGIDTLRTDHITLECLGLTPWWPSPATGFRFCYQLDNNPWSEYSYQSVLGLYALDRGPHVVSVRAKGPHLKTDPTPAVFHFYVDVPTILSDWRFWAGIGALLLALAALILRKQLAWYLRLLRYRNFKPISPNPFNPAQPTTEKKHFFGRDEVLEAIGESFRGKQAGNVAIIIQGQEKIGVSSLLLQASEQINSMGGTAVYLDLADQYFPDAGSLLAHLTSRLAGADSSLPEAQDDSPITPDSLRRMLEARDEPVAFIFDNAELLGRVLQQNTEPGAQVVSLFREALLGERGASFVFGLHNLDTFHQHCNVFYNMSRIMRLAPVSEDSTRMIIEEPLTERAWFHDQALSLLIRLSRGQPHLAHHLGHQLVELINRESTNLCTMEMAERAIDVLIENPPDEILDRWEDLGKTEKLLLSAAVSTIESPQASTTVAIPDIAGLLRTLRIGLLEEELAKASASLADRGMIRLESVGERLTVEDSLFNRWIAASQPVELVNAREEYDFGAVVHKISEELNRSFNVQELGERMLGSLKATLRFGWGALLSVAPVWWEDSDSVSLECTAAIGMEAETAGLPGELSSSAAEFLNISSAAVIVGDAALESDRPAVELPFEDGTILIPLLSRGELSGLLSLGPRRGGQRYSRRDRQLLETTSEQAAVAIENARLYEEETEKQRLKQELETARHMQMSLLPERNFEIPQLDFAAYLTPATEVGGDYFDYRLIDEGQFMFIIGDVSGHGISASTLVSMSKSLIYNQVKTSYEVDKVMAAMNDMVQGALAERLLMTLCYTIFDLKNRKIRYSIAGHPFPYHYQVGSGELKELELSAYPLGVTSKAKYAVAETEYDADDVLIFYSDGIVEGMNPEDEQLGFQRFEKMILKNKHLSAEEINRNIIKEFYLFANEQPQDDDITLVVIKAK